MKHILFTLLAMVVLLGTTIGCARTRQGCSTGCVGGCNDCGPVMSVDDAVDAYGHGIDPNRSPHSAIARGQGGDCGPDCGPGYGRHGNGRFGGTLSKEARCALQANFNGPPGPPSAQVTYPYYTTRGPRDFLLANPPTIGP